MFTHFLFSFFLTFTSSFFSGFPLLTYQFVLFPLGSSVMVCSSSSSSSMGSSGTFTNPECRCLYDVKPTSSPIRALFLITSR